MVGLVDLLVLLLYFYTWLIIVRAVVSWMTTSADNPLMQILYALTEPVLKPLRALAPPSRLGGIDISPLLAIAVIQILRYLLLGAIR